uniref:Apple domain-containing protein n=1 Tax=Romanomermis culicivorax TaxID=13658 RepID=A0A915L524_ROMCU
MLLKCQSRCPTDYNQSALYYYYVNLNECCNLGSSELLNVQGCIQDTLKMNSTSLCSDRCALDQKGCHGNTITADLIQSFKTKSPIRVVDFVRSPSLKMQEMFDKL